MRATSRHHADPRTERRIRGVAGGRVGKLTLLALALATSLAASAQQDPVAAVMAAATERVREHHAGTEGELEVRARAPDARLRLTACDGALATELAMPQRQAPTASVRVRCTGSAAWNVNILLDVSLRRDVLVAARPFARGETLVAADLRTETRDVMRLPYGYIAEAASVDGARLARPVSSGATLNPGMLASRLLVERGRPVTIVAGGGAVAIRAAGVALEDGVVGATVRVRNPSSGRVLTGTVDADGAVVVAR